MRIEAEPRPCRHFLRRPALLARHEATAGLTLTLFSRPFIGGETLAPLYGDDSAPGDRRGLRRRVGGAATYTVRLDTEPAGTATVSVAVEAGRCPWTAFYPVTLVDDEAAARSMVTTATGSADGTLTLTWRRAALP